MNSTTNTYTCPMHPEIIQDKPGNCPKCGMNLVLVKPEAGNPGQTQQGVEDDHHQHKSVDAAPHTDNQSLQKYTCPMHPHILRDQPGKCPICGMNLEPVAGGAHGGVNHAGMIADFRKRFIVVLMDH